MAKNELHEKTKTFFSYHPSPWKDTFVPPFDYLIVTIEVYGLKSNMISKLIINTERKESLKSVSQKTYCLSYTDLSAWNSPSQACLVMLSFWDTQLPQRRARKRKILLTSKKISNISNTTWFSAILKTNCVRFSVEWVNYQILEVKGSRFQLVWLRGDNMG